MRCEINHFGVGMSTGILASSVDHDIKCVWIKTAGTFRPSPTIAAESC